MKFTLAATGTATLLQQLSPFVPDGFINDLCRAKPHPGPRSLYGPTQLYRVHLLALLTAAHTFNLLVELLNEKLKLLFQICILSDIKVPTDHFARFRRQLATHIIDYP